MNDGFPDRRLVLLVAEYAYFLSHRLDLAQAAAADGYEVHVVTRVPDGTIAGSWPGITIMHMDLRRSVRNPLRDIGTVLRLRGLFRRLRPGIVHNVSVKLVVLGSLAARLAAVPGIVNAYTGLGYSFRSRGWAAASMRMVISPLLAVISRYRGCWSIFQNRDDLEIMRRRGLVVAERTLLIEGSGVNVAAFKPAPEPRGEPVVLFVGRLLWDKGLGEFVEAANRLRRRGISARFRAAGERDMQNPRSVDAHTLRGWQQAGTVEWLGRREDMPHLYRDSHIVCLPTHHEGLPKVLLEAAACGRPVVATRIAACETVVEDGVTGLLVPVGDAGALAIALEKLIVNNELRVKLGRNGRQRVERCFAVDIINRRILELYRTVEKAPQMRAARS